jgi:hypothetical protein
VRHLHRRRGQARDRREAVEDLFEREVLATEDVALAGSAALQRHQVHPRNLFHIDEVQTGVHIRGKVLVQEVDDDASGRRGLGVERADGCGRIQDDDLLSCMRRFDRNLLGQPLGALVVADHRGLAHRGIFVHHSVTVEAHRRNAAGVDHARHARLASQPQQLACAFDVGLVHLCGLGHP